MAPPMTTHKTGVWSKLRLLMWKNYMLQIRHKFQTLLDIALPVLMFVLLAYLQKFSSPEVHPEIAAYPSLEVNTLDYLWKAPDPFPPIKEKRLIFHPNNTIFDDLMKKVSDTLKLDSPVGVNEENQLESIMVKNGFIAAIQFHHSATIKEIPKDLSYSLRFPSELRTTELSSLMSDRYNWYTNRNFPTDEFNSPRHLPLEDGGPPSYHHEGFLAIQNAVTRAFILINGNGTQMPDVHIKRFPYPQYKTNIYSTILQIILPLFVLLSFNYSFSNSVRFIAVEKEKQLKETMKIMGLPNWLHWLSWFLRSMMMLTVSVIFIMILLKTPCFGSSTAVFQNSNAFLLTIFFLLYCVALTTLSFLSSTLFSKSKTAVTVASIVWYLSYAPYFITHSKYDVIPGSLKILFCLFPNTAMAYGIKLILRNEEIGDGLQFSTMWQPVHVYDSLTIGIAMFFLLLSSFVFFVLTLYIESIFPGNYGVAKPWYFPFKREFWCRSQKQRNYQSFDEHDDENGSSREADAGNFEEEPTDEFAGVVIKNLCKAFGKDLVVDNLSMNMYNNQITALLGHNGAGKTTTFSMLTGMLQPTTGTALINGYDIRTQTERARSSMGFCPQHNILFDELTVREHIFFFSRLKGLDAKAADEEVNKYVRLLELEPKMNVISEQLSGGMKRKLSIGIALCGQSKVVFCDEPTSGMDAASRRSLWNVLIEEKKDRVIVLTTHFMDEADVLGDRIAIMAHGRLKCFGSSFFLKKTFGTGYHLICAKKYDCNSDFVTGLLRKYLPELQIASENESEITYLLPEDQVPVFHQMFTDLEQNEQNLNLNSYGVSLTTMEEIFMKFGKDSVLNKKADEKPVDAATASEIISITENHFNETLLLKGVALLRNQAIAAFKKRFLCWLRSWKIVVYYNIIAIIILAPTCFDGFRLSKSSNGLPALDISLDKYVKPIVLVQENRNSSSFLSDIIQQYQQNVFTHSQNTKVETTEGNLNSFLLNLAGQSITTFNYQYVTAVSAVNNGTILAWFNNQFYHTASLALNLVHNAIIRTIINPASSIHVTNAPFDFIVRSDSTDVENVSIFGITLTFAIGITMSLVSSSYIMFYVQEKECRAKFLQYASGINLTLFWAASILWDVLTNMVTVVLIVIMLAVGQREFYSNASTLGVIALLIIMFNVAMMPVICLASLIFKKPTTGVNVMFFASLIISVLFATDLVIDFMHSALKVFVVAYPTSTLISGFMKLAKIDEIVGSCNRECEADNCDRQKLCSTVPSCCPNLLFSWNENSVSKDLVIMLATSVVAIGVLLLIEGGWLDRLISRIYNLRPRKLSAIHVEEEPLDEDVREVKERVNAMTIRELREQNLVLQNVSKFYGSFLAVNQASLEIKQSECFGLLGNNGAGKTSIFKMLTGEERISSGEIFLQGLNMKTDIRRIYKCIGYCPQFDALFENLTAREILEIFSLIRGVPPNAVVTYAVQAATDLDLIEHVDKKVSQLSGGNKRKLSTALALVGNPKVIFLDEPTTGMDPATKRNLWNIIIKLRDQGKSIVLTSHSMEECEALCTQLTIMVNGNCKCYGSSQHLKNKFTRGFELKIKVKQDPEGQRSTSVKEYIANAFNGAVLTDEQQDLLTYTIPSRSLKWSAVFLMMENGKQTGSIDDYSVSQNSLEQVLLSFVKNQRARNEQKNKVE